MSYRHTLEAAVESLHEVEDLVKAFPLNGKIPGIEIDLALQKLRNLYELLLLMKGSEEPVTGSMEVQKETATASVSTEDQSESNIRENRKEEESLIKEDKKEEAKVVIVEESKTTTVSLTTEEEKTIRKSSKNNGMDIQTLADQFKGRPTLLETLSPNYSHESETLGHTQRITDLMTAIALNDRFTFIRELFNNDKKSFEAAIAVLNATGNYDDAFAYIRQFNWDMENEAVQLLLGVVRRKFIR